MTDVTTEDQTNDPLVTVCADCLCASCWYAEFICQGAMTADIKQMRRSELIALGREHPDYWTDEARRDGRRRATMGTNTIDAVCINCGHDASVHSEDRCKQCDCIGLATLGKRLRSKAELLEKLEQHRENVRLWTGGFLAQTEPDPDERAAILRELKAAIFTLEWVLGEHLS